MKYILSLCLLISIASCGTDVETPTTIDKTNTEINSEIENIEADEKESKDETSDNDSQIIKTAYENPKGNVDMEISYDVDENNRITSIAVTSEDYDVTNFSAEVEKQAKGKTLEEAASIYISGSSLTTEAYQKAMKDIK